ncbi:MAG: hypothetical protein VX012_06490 [Planctomycetota bacterium]|nr:hypothetical protein [Planctomycetota bacterium]
MKVSSTRLDRYAAIAACGSGAVGVAVSPLHADIQYFGSEFTLSLSGASNTFDSARRSISGGGVEWSLQGNRYAVFYSTSFFTNTFYGGFFSSGTSLNRSATRWTAFGPAIGRSLFNPGDQIDLAAIQSGSGYLSLFNRFSYRYYSFYVTNTIGSIHGFSDSFGSGSTTGAMSPGQRGFLALGFELDGDRVFGWADISLSTDGLSLTVHGWAFEDSGEAIIAGQTGASNAVPGLGGLAALACGAAGLRRRRDRVA